MGPAIQIVRPGLLTSVQDLGRPGYLGMALSRGGAMDTTAARLANRLVGNPEEAALLEITGMGPAITMTARTGLAWTGADFGLEVRTPQATRQWAASHRPVVVPAGAQLRWTAPRRGFRAWIAFAGGIDLPVVLGSRSGHLAAALGPGRLTGGESLSLGVFAPEQTDRLDALLRSAVAEGGPVSEAVVVPRWHIPMQLPEGGKVISLQAFEGRHYHSLSQAQQARLWQTIYGVSPQSSRQGLRLEGPPMNDPAPQGIASEPVRYGTVQLPPEGIPYVLLAEHQTTGGYLRVLEVCSTMACALAQAGPGSQLRFVPTSLASAQQRLQAQAAQCEAIGAGIAARLRL
nr:KipI antagonist [Cupriavidus sp.]